MFRKKRDYIVCGLCNDQKKEYLFGNIECDHFNITSDKYNDIITFYIQCKSCYDIISFNQNTKYFFFNKFLSEIHNCSCGNFLFYVVATSHLYRYEFYNSYMYYTAIKPCTKCDNNIIHNKKFIMCSLCLGNGCQSCNKIGYSLSTQEARCRHCLSKFEKRNLFDPYSMCNSNQIIL